MMHSSTRFTPMTTEPTQEMKPAMNREQQIRARMETDSPTRFMTAELLHDYKMPPPIRFIRRLSHSTLSTRMNHENNDKNDKNDNNDDNDDTESSIHTDSTVSVPNNSNARHREYIDAFISGGETIRQHNTTHHKYAEAFTSNGKTIQRHNTAHHNYAKAFTTSSGETIKRHNTPHHNYAEAFTSSGETIKRHNTTHRDHALLSRYRQDGVVAPWSPSGGINEEMDSLVRDWSRGDLGEHDIQIDRAEDLLQGVECETTQFAFDEIGAVLHDSLKLDMPVTTLPPRDEVKHVRALSCPPVLSALIAGESHRERGEEREICGLVAHSQQPSEKVDLAGNCGDRQEAGGPYDEEGEYCLVAKTCKL